MIFHVIVFLVIHYLHHICIFVKSFSDNSLSYFAIFQDRMIPSRKYHIQTFQTLTTNQCARLCYNTLLTDGLTKQSTDNQDPKCQSFEMITTGGRPICALSNVSAGSNISGGYSSLVRSPGTSYYEAPRGLYSNMLAKSTYNTVK